MNTPTKLGLETHAATLSSSAMLVELSISVWGGTKIDRTASKQVTTDNHAKDNVARVSKSLMGDNETLKLINKYRGEVRNHTHYRYTMPWTDTGIRLLPTTAYFEYNQQMTECQQHFDTMVTGFIDNYEQSVLDAELSMGTLFDREDYPSADSIRDKFDFRISYIPLAESGDFRVDIGNEALTEIKTAYETAYQDNIESAMKSLWDRLYESLKAMSDRLGYDADGNKKKFKDSLMGNMSEVLEVLRVCNVTESPQMSHMVDQLDAALSGISPDILRSDTYVRDDVKVKIDRAIKALPSLDW